MVNADFLEDYFKHPTYKKGVKTFDGMKFTSRNNEFEGRIKDLILEYESYGPQSPAKDRANHQQEADMTAGEVRAMYFAYR
jgi:hypothetical protein